MQNHEDDLSEYFSTKRENKTIVFSVRDIHITPRGNFKPKHILSSRKSLSQWLFHRMEAGELKIGEFVITTHIRRPPFKYIATRQV